MQPNELAGLIALTVKNAMAPLSERLSRVETFLKKADILETFQNEHLSRIVRLETKSEQSAQVLPGPDVFGVVTAALTPYIERLVRVEEGLQSAQKSFTDTIARALLDIAKDTNSLRSDLDAIDTKIQTPPAVVEHDSIKDLNIVRDTMTALDSRVQVKLAAKDVEIVNLMGRCSELERQLHEKTEALTATRERIAGLEARAPIPGPQGPAGKDGINGKDGKDGADGLGFSDITVEYDGERQFSFVGYQGDRKKTLGTGITPAPIYRGQFSHGREYAPGDMVTYAGSLFHCNKSTRLKPDESPIDTNTGKPFGEQGQNVWTLAAKRGRDGKDGKDAITVPVVSIAGGSK